MARAVIYFDSAGIEINYRAALAAGRFVSRRATLCEAAPGAGNINSSRCFANCLLRYSARGATPNAGALLPLLFPSEGRRRSNNTEQRAKEPRNPAAKFCGRARRQGVLELGTKVGAKRRPLRQQKQRGESKKRVLRARYRQAVSSAKCFARLRCWPGRLNWCFSL
jgi:hypothetical protein